MIIPARFSYFITLIALILVFSASYAGASTINLDLGVVGQILETGAPLELTIKANYAGAAETLVKIELAIYDVNNNDVWKKEITQELKGDMPGSISLDDKVKLAAILQPGFYILKATEVTRDGVTLTEADNPISGYLRFGIIRSRPKPGDPEFVETPFGIDGALSWFCKTDASLKNASDLIAKLGIGIVRDRISWNHVERVKGRYNWKNRDADYDRSARIQSEAGLTVYQIFHDTAAWAADAPSDAKVRSRFPPRDWHDLDNFIREAVKRYKDQVRYWEIWNEMDSPYFFGGTAEAYTDLLKTAYIAAKQSDPKIDVLLGATTLSMDNVTIGDETFMDLEGERFIEKIFENGGGDYFDIYNMHCYGPVDGVINQIARNRGIQEKYGYSHPIWLTEMGSTSTIETPAEVLESERDQAEYLIKAYTLSLADGVEKFFYFIFPTFLERGHMHWGIFSNQEENWVPKPGYIALANLVETMGRAQFIGEWSPEKGVRGFVFKPEPIAEPVLIIWSDEPRMIAVPGAGEDIITRDIYGHETKSFLIDGITKISLTSQPLIVKGISRTVLMDAHSTQIDALMSEYEVKDWPAEVNEWTSLAVTGVKMFRKGQAEPLNSIKARLISSLNTTTIPKYHESLRALNQTELRQAHLALIKLDRLAVDMVHWRADFEDASNNGVVSGDLGKDCAEALTGFNRKYMVVAKGKKDFPLAMSFIREYESLKDYINAADIPADAYEVYKALGKVFISQAAAFLDLETALNTRVWVKASLEKNKLARGAKAALNIEAYNGTLQPVYGDIEITLPPQLTTSSDLKPRLDIDGKSKGEIYMLIKVADDAPLGEYPVQVRYISHGQRFAPAVAYLNVINPFRIDRLKLNDKTLREGLMIAPKVKNVSEQVVNGGMFMIGPKGGSVRYTSRMMPIVELHPGKEILLNYSVRTIVDDHFPAVALTFSLNSNLGNYQYKDFIEFNWINSSENPPLLDGKRTAWKEANIWYLSLPSQLVHGAAYRQNYADLSSTIFSLMDEEALYFRFDVADDSITNPHREKEPWRGDAVEIFIDTRKGRDLGRAEYDDNVYQLFFILPEGDSGEKTAELRVMQPAGRVLDGIENSLRLRKNGYYLEVKIPLTNFPNLAGVDETQIGLDFAIDDLDAGAPDHSQIIWRGTLNNWRDPSGFPKITLRKNK